MMNSKLALLGSVAAQIGVASAAAALQPNTPVAAAQTIAFEATLNPTLVTVCLILDHYSYDCIRF